MERNSFLTKIDFSQAPNLNFVTRLTNQTGIIQHTKYAVPNRSMGYSVDDNARGLLVASLYYKLFGDEKALDLAIIYLSFIDQCKTEDNFFYNFLTFDNRFEDKSKTEDGFGRCFWGLGYTVFANPRRDITRGAIEILKQTRVNLDNLNSPRAKAYCLLGLFYLTKAQTEETFWEQHARKLANDLVALYKKNSSKDWQWFEPYLTYSNAILPMALFQAYDLFGDKVYFDIAQESLEFLDRETRKDKTPSPIGSDGWYLKGKDKAVYDQQPVEAADMVIAYLSAYKVTVDETYLKKAREWFAWYFGNNIAGIEVYDEVTKGCFDAITPTGVNLNQGAESILTYLIAYLAFCDIKLKVGK